MDDHPEKPKPPSVLFAGDMPELLRGMEIAKSIDSAYLATCDAVVASIVESYS